MKTKPPPHRRVYTCDHCGLSIDRDHNAEVNLARIATAATGQSVPTPLVRLADALAAPVAA